MAHFGDNINQVLQAEKLFAFEELLTLALTVGQTKMRQTQQKCPPLKIDNKYLADFALTLPFKLTNGQRLAAWEIIQDLALSRPMNRLLYGEVGSGKTAISLLVAAAVIRNGKKVVMLTPTLALAHQQASVCSDILSKSSLKVAQITASRKDNCQDADLIIGTHALLQKKIKLQNIGLVIIDEQHRFGVEQRGQLLGPFPKAHVLMMTATPIPRSLSQTIFGHLDITYLLDKPAHQKEITTKIFLPSHRKAIEQEIENRLNQGEPGYVICPLINEPSEELSDLFSLERKNVEGEFKVLNERFPNFSIQMLHGRMKPKEKEKIISDFRAGKIDILLATTVVEVGIDNPKATWILIEEADRLGLSQLHQLRGRVGRGDKESVCYLSNSLNSSLGDMRLQALLSSSNGLDLAEKDLALRGPGEIVGLEQSGLPPLRYASWSDSSSLKKAFRIAQHISKEGLEKFPALAQNVEKQMTKNEELSRV
jgi:ATP-dependent DNA helicase RecG